MGLPSSRALPQRFGPPDDTKLAVVSNPTATWVIGQGGSLAEQVDPTSLAPLGPPQQLAVAAPPVLIPDGSLWTTQTGGVVESFANGVAHTRTRPAAGPFTLLAADARPVLAEPAQHDIVVLDAHRGQPAFNVAFDPPETSPQVSGSANSPYVMAVGSHTSNLEVIDLQDRRAATIAIGDPSPRVARYGPAVIKDNLIFVPDYLQGAVIVVRVAHDTLTLVGQVTVGLDDQFVLLTHNNNVWFDDPTGNSAGVITTDLTAIAIAKVGGNGQGHLVGHRQPVHFATPAGGSSHHDGGSNNNGTNNGDDASKTNKRQRANKGNHVNKGSDANKGSTNKGGGTNNNNRGGNKGGGSQQNPPATPTFTWSPTQPATGQPVTFTDTTPGPHRVDQWTFQQGNPATTTATPRPTVTWTQPGTYTVTLTVTNNGSSSSTATSTDRNRHPTTNRTQLLLDPQPTPSRPNRHLP